MTFEPLDIKGKNADTHAVFPHGYTPLSGVCQASLLVTSDLAFAE